jgi:hypothetical protein
MRTGSYNTFEKRYQPSIKEDGTILFETYGHDLEEVINTNYDHIWTLLDCDGKLRISAGYHLVNRMNYIITQKPWKNKEECYSY